MHTQLQAACDGLTAAINTHVTTEADRLNLTERLFALSEEIILAAPDDSALKAAVEAPDVAELAAEIEADVEAAAAIADGET